MLFVETYSDAHRDSVAALITGIQQQEFGVPITLADQPDLLDVPGFYQQGSGQFWVAVLDGKVVGTIGLKDIGGGGVALRKMFVSPEARGTGGASQPLLDAAIAHAGAKRIDAVYLGTTSKFHAAHRFYEKNGFDRIAEAALPDSFPRMVVDTIFYVRRLTQV